MSKLKKILENILRNEVLFLELNKKLYNEIDKLEQYSRRKNLRILGVPETENENVEDKVKTIIQNNLKIPLECRFIDNVHRIGKKIENKSRTIMAKFVKIDDRNRIFNNNILLKASGVAIVEDLTKRRYTMLKKIQKSIGTKNVWTRNGNIHVNTKAGLKLISNEDDIEKVLELDVNTSKDMQPK